MCNMVNDMHILKFMEIYFSLLKVFHGFIFKYVILPWISVSDLKFLNTFGNIIHY